VDAAQADRGGEGRDALDCVGLLRGVADRQRVHQRAPGQHLVEAEDVAEQQAPAHRGQLGAAQPVGDQDAGDALVRPHRRDRGGQLAAGQEHDHVAALRQAVGQLGELRQLQLRAPVVAGHLARPVKHEQLCRELAGLDRRRRGDLADLGAGRRGGGAQGPAEPWIGSDGDDPALRHGRRS
jgi:hypothetical protein